MKGMSFGNSPVNKKLPIDRSKGFDLDYTASVSAGKPELIKEMEDKYKAGKITKKELNRRKKEIKSFQDR